MARSPASRVEVRQRAGQRRGEQRPVAIGELLAQVDDIDHGRATDGLLPQGQALDAPLGDSAHGGHIRRRAGQDDRRRRQPAELDGHVPRLEAWRPIRLVGRVVLLVDDDDPEVGDRRQEGGPGADDDAHAVLPDPPPLVGSLTFAEAGVQHGHVLGRLGAQPVQQGRGKGDLRHQHEGPATESTRRA